MLNRLAVVGGGLCGPCMANILSPYFKYIDVFERSSEDNFNQGLGLDISENGKKALYKAGITEDIYWNFTRKNSNTFKFYLRGNRKPLYNHTGGGCESNRLEMRNALFELLYTKKNVNIIFNQNVESIVSTMDADNNNNSNAATLFDDKNKSLGLYDLVIDSSGIGSKLRKYRIDPLTVPNRDDEHEWMGITTKSGALYTGRDWIYGVINNPEKQLHPGIVKELGEGTSLYIDFDGHGSICLQRFGSSYDDKRTAFGYVFDCNKPQEYKDDIGVGSTFSYDPKIKHKVKNWCHKKMGNNWHKVFHDAVDNLEFVSLHSHFQSPKHAKLIQDKTLPLILMGDALHTVPGQGGELAMEDVHFLSEFSDKGITNNKLNIDWLRKTEEKMLSNAAHHMSENPVESFTEKISHFLGTDQSAKDPTDDLY